MEEEDNIFSGKHLRRGFLFVGGGACPEQYEVFLKNEQVAYCRLRHGRFTVTCPNCHKRLVYSASPNGDGSFFPDERDYYLDQAAAAIEEHLTDNNLYPDVFTWRLR